MASVVGGHHVFGGADAGHGPAAGTPEYLGAFSLSLITQPQSLSGGREMLLGGSHNTISGAYSTGDTVAGTQGVAPGAEKGSGPDTVTGPEHGMPVAGGNPLATDEVVATQTHHHGDTTLHLSDGSSITVIGAAHIDSSFFH